MTEIICNSHGIALDLSAGCPACLAEWDLRPDPDSMTGEERGAELNEIVSQLTVPFELAHQRIEKLVGRPVFTHEIGLAYKRLLEEAKAPRPSVIRSN